MKNKLLLWNLLLAGIALGTAWAIRGQFGHEQGAAWAGGIGGLTIVLLSKRRDWYQKALQLSLASAAGWGIAGIISYGIVVGYGRASDFGNAYYGLSMLFVIGGLFGLLGGGLFGLMLSDNAGKQINWPRLLTEMCIGAVVFYYFLIEQMGWLMTPPRSEAWACCFGMCVAMFWYMIREKHFSAMRVAVYAGLGGGFGFAFGNFLQVMGHVSGARFNFWNVMEYSIGFFGGIGMAYGTFTSEWPVTDAKTAKNRLLAPLLILSLLIPLIVWDQSFKTERISETITHIRPDLDVVQWTAYTQVAAFLLVIAFAAYWMRRLYLAAPGETQLTRDDIRSFLLSNLTLYTVYSLLITGAFLSLYRIEQYLYILNLGVLTLLINRFQPHFSKSDLDIRRWAISLAAILLVIALFTAIAVNSHGELNGSHTRFAVHL